MPLVQAKCTNCGAGLSVDSSKDAAICSYCGSAFVVEKAINNYIITNAQINAQTVNVNVGIGDFIIEGGILKKYIGNDANVEIPNIVKVIEKDAFVGIECIERITIPSSVTRINQTYINNDLYSYNKGKMKDNCYDYADEIFCCFSPGAFDNCINLKEIILCGDLEIPENTFANCISIEKITYPLNCVITYVYSTFGGYGTYRGEKSTLTGIEIEYVLPDLRSPLSKKLIPIIEEQNRKALDEVRRKNIELRRNGLCQNCGAKLEIKLFKVKCPQCNTEWDKSYLKV